MKRLTAIAATAALLFGMPAAARATAPPPITVLAKDAEVTVEHPLVVTNAPAAFLSPGKVTAFWLGGPPGLYVLEVDFTAPGYYFHGCRAVTTSANIYTDVSCSFPYQLGPPKITLTALDGSLEGVWVVYYVT